MLSYYELMLRRACPKDCFAAAGRQTYFLLDLLVIFMSLLYEVVDLRSLKEIRCSQVTNMSSLRDCVKELLTFMYISHERKKLRHKVSLWEGATCANGMPLAFVIWNEQTYSNSVGVT